MADNETACIIGKGIQIRGNLSGSGDLIVEGRVEGHVSLQDHITVDDSGIVVADIETRELTVNGNMSGNIDASQRVSISSTATVVGDVRAPRVVIEDGARFRGNIEMDVPLPPDI
ncbi:MAG: polymer-forming cytoskeletal protein [Deltaproteobacteria bacterium]|nr:polymer-forming cytoskeletal protein [Deltaproteobacteria bacterium]